MEACLLVTKNKKAKEQKGKVLFINAVKEVRQDKNIAYLEENHIQTIFNAYNNYKDVPGLARVVEIDEVMVNNGKLAINLYVAPANSEAHQDIALELAMKNWEQSTASLKKSMNELLEILG